MQPQHCKASHCYVELTGNLVLRHGKSPFHILQSSVYCGMDNIEIRTIQSTDNKELASIIRNSLAEFGANKPGTVDFDPTTDHLSELFKTPGSRYLVAQVGDEIVGGAGIFP